MTKISKSALNAMEKDFKEGKPLPDIISKRKIEAPLGEVRRQLREHMGGEAFQNAVKQIRRNPTLLIDRLPMMQERLMTLEGEDLDKAISALDSVLSSLKNKRANEA